MAMECEPSSSEVRGSAPRKARLVADQIRGKGVEEALAILQLSPKRAARADREAAAVRGRERRAEERAREGRHRRRQLWSCSDRWSTRARAQWRFRPRAQGRATDPASGTQPRRPWCWPSDRRDSMGQKIHPVRLPARHPLRVGLELVRGAALRAAAPRGPAASASFIKKKLYHAGISKIVIERTGDKVMVNIHTARPGILIGKRGAEVDTLRKELAQLTESEVFINIKEIRKAELDAQLVAENIAMQLERRVAFRRAMKKAVTVDDEVRRAGRPHPVRRAASAAPRWRAASGTAKAACRCTRCAPTSTTASPRRSTTYGMIGVKCWIFKGDVADRELQARARWRRAPGRRGGALGHAAAEEGQVPQAAEGPHARQGVPRRDGRVRRLRPAGARVAASSRRARSRRHASR